MRLSGLESWVPFDEPVSCYNPLVPCPSRVVQKGQVPFATLKQACQGSENLVSQMFTSSTEGLVTLSDFIASIEALYQGISGLSQSIDNT
eukprot:scaffold13993_cov51-Attheya_sp.AAC.4